MSASLSVRASVPATIGNIACGFDVLGLAVDRPRDVVVARATAGPGVSIDAIYGDDGRLPTDPARNAASAAATSVLQRVGAPGGLALEIHKGVPLSGGLGGSAASAVAGAVAANALLGAELPKAEVLRCAVDGEQAGSGAAHADNAAPALYGGIVLILPGGKLHVVELPVPDELWAVVVHPHLEVETQGARRVLGDSVPLSAAVTQWGNTAGLVAGLYREDWDLIGRTLVDVVAEPWRAASVPGFPGAKAAALASGALGCSLSGSGPSVFALCRGSVRAEAAGNAIREAFLQEAALDSDVFVSRVNREGARVDHSPADTEASKSPVAETEAASEPATGLDAAAPDPR